MRNLTIDVAKGIAAVLVVVGHTLAYKQQPGWLAGSTHIASPLFFFLAGSFLSLHKPLLPWLARKADGLLKPYLVVLTMLGICYFLLGKIDSLQYISGMLYAAGSTIMLLPLWFLPHLFLAVCCAAMLLYAGEEWRWPQGVWLLLALLLLSVAPVVLALGLPPLPLSADLLPVSVALLLLGRVFAPAVKVFSVNIVLFFLAGIVGVCAVVYGHAAIDMNLRIYRDPFFTTAMVVSGIYCLLCCAAWLQNVPWLGVALAYFGRYSLLVLLFHLLWLRLLFRLPQYGLEHSASWQIVLVVIACLLLCALTIRIVCVNRWLSLLLLPVARNRSAG